MRFNIQAEMFFTYIEKLVDAGNRSRALKLCHAAGNLPVARVMEAGLKLRLPGSFDSRDALADAAVDALLPEAETQSKRFMPIALIAIVGVLGGLALPLLTQVEAWVRIAAAIASVLASVNLVRLVFRIRRDVYTTVGVVAPLVGGHIRSREEE